MDTKFCDVSVIIPAYNAQEYLSDCLASLHHQTLSPKEIILVDDCSTDSTLSVAASWQERFAASGIDFQIVPSKQNQGAGNARNEGLNRATGAAIYFIDADDVVLANLFADFRTAQIAETADIHWFSADTFHAAQLDHASSSREPTLRMPISGRFHRDEAIKLIRENGTLHVNVFLYIFDKRILGDLRFLSHNCHEDHAFTALLLARAATVRCSEISYVHKRVRPNSVMTSKHGQYNADSYLACADAIATDYAAQKASANRSYPYEFLRQRISLTLLCGRSLWRESNMGFVLRLFRSETFVLRMGVPLFTRRVLNRFRAPGQRRWGGASQST